MNKAILIGNLTRDPEMRTTKDGAALCRFTLAVTRRVPGRDGARQADFIPIVAWRGIAELCGKHLLKGRKVAVIGEIRTHACGAQDGAKRFTTQVAAEEVRFLWPREKGGAEPEGAFFAMGEPAGPQGGAEGEAFGPEGSGEPPEGTEREGLCRTGS